jgi:hypothetical protein
MKQILSSVFIFALLITGCSDKENNMPEGMPKDFNFIVQFGPQLKNEINTFKDTVTKDLISDGTVTASVSFTDKEMNTIYQKMKDINKMAPKKLVPDNTSCRQIPHGEGKWKIQLNGETQILNWNGEYCECPRNF